MPGPACVFDHMSTRTSPLHPVALMVVFALAVSACSSGNEGRSSDASPVDDPTPPATSPVEGDTGVIAELPDGSRDATGDGEPRTASHWVQWSSCGEDSRAAEAEANGGAAAGWHLVDDLLEPPVDLAGFVISGCHEAVAVLEPDVGAAFDRLAALTFAAELNLRAGAESCEAVTQSIAAAKLALSGLGYTGPGTVTEEPGLASLQLIDLLTAYNSGELCR